MNRSVKLVRFLKRTQLNFCYVTVVTNFPHALSLFSPSLSHVITCISEKAKRLEFVYGPQQQERTLWLADGHAH